MVAQISEVRLPRRMSMPQIFFALLLVAQAGHLIEHLVQLVQLYAWGIPKQHAHGIVGALDIEWVHFIWNLLVLAVVILIAYWFRSNPWVMLALILASWHQIEHIYILITYLTTGVSGSPGLLSRGGIIGGGLALPRPILHFVYNFVEMVPLVIAFIGIRKRSAVGQEAKAVHALLI